MLGFFLAFVTVYLSVLFLLIYMENAEEMEDPQPSRFPSIDIIVPAYNEEEHIAETIESLLELEYEGKKRIIVVNDGSKDRTLAVAKRFVKKGVLVLDKPNGGKASAMNVGLKHANAELVAVLDADSIVAEDALGHMVGYFDDKRVAAVTPMMKVWRSSTPVQALQRAEYIVNSFAKKVLEQLDSITVTPGPFSIYRRDVLSKLGGFDEKTVTEDQEIALRIQKANWKIASSYGAVVYTDAPSSLLELYKQRKRWYRGFLENAWRYRGLIHPSYGDLGMFVLPSTLALVVVGIFGLFYSLYSTLASPFALRVDLAPMFLGPSELVIAIAALCSFSLVILAARKLNERNPVSLFISTAIMSPLMAVFWLFIILGAVKDSISGVRLAWKGEG